MMYAKGSKTTNTVRDPDNLRSEDSAELLIGISEGPIYGLEDGEKSFYVDDTSLVSVDGTRNFSDFNLDIKKGGTSEDETIKLEMGGTARATSVGTELKKSISITRTTQSGDIDYIDIRITVNSLYNQSSSGDITSGVVYFKIEYKLQSSNTWTVYTGDKLSVSGKTTSAYVKDYRIPVSRNTTAPYEIRITKLSDDSPTDSGAGFYNTIVFTQFEEIDAKTRSFPNTAIAHLNIKTSDEITSMPQFSGIYKLLIVKVPSNYDPITKTYNGEWDGTFKMEWTDNPAWCLYDLIMNDRYGVNAYQEVVADKWDFYEAGKYCDELVPSGVEDEKEARYTLNTIIQETQSGPEMINYIAATFNATIYEDATGIVRLNYESDKPAVHVFTPENITPDGFYYSFTDPAARPNEITVSFMNPNLNWVEDRRMIQNQEQIEIWGRTPEDFTAVGCIKESEAIRRARYRMIGGLKEVMSVSFTTNRAGQCVNLFDTILIADPVMGYSVSGRIKSVSEDLYTVYLRDPVFIEAGVNDYFIKIQTGSGIYELAVDVREYGSVKEIHLLDKVPEDAPENSVFYLTGSDSLKGDAKPFKVLSVKEAEGDPEKITIEAIEIHRNKQYEADYGIELPVVESNQRPSYQIVPQILDLKFNMTYDSVKKQTNLQLTPVLDTNRYPYYTGSFLCWSRPTGLIPDGSGPYPWEQRELVYGDTIVDHPSGVYEFRVLPKTTLGSLPDFDTAPIFTYEVMDITLPPADVEGFEAEGNVNNVILTWKEIIDFSIIYYEIRYGDDWETGERLAVNLTDLKYYDVTAEGTTRKYMIKAINIVGVYSKNYAFVYGTLSKPNPVKRFYVTPNRDSLRFDWDADFENGVEYEVRMGGQWDSAVTLFKVKGTNNTILNPGNGEFRFWIRSISSSGVYSEETRYAEARLDLHQNRNVILQINNVQNNWDGITYGLEKSGEFDDVLNMKPDVFYAEHYFKVQLPEVTRARNWYDTEAFKYGTRLTFADLDYAWSSDEASKQTWLNELELATVVGTKFETVIMTKEENVSLLNDSFTLDNTLNNYNNTKSPVAKSNIYYGPAHYSDGLVLNKIVDLGYNIGGLSSEYSLRFSLKLTTASVSFIDVLYIKSLNELSWLYLYIEDSVLVLKRSDDVKIELPFSRFDYLDFLYVSIKQTSDKLTLAYNLEYAKIKTEKTVEANPLPNNFARIYIGGRRGNG